VMMEWLFRPANRSPFIAVSGLHNYHMSYATYARG